MWTDNARSPWQCLQTVVRFLELRPMGLVTMGLVTMGLVTMELSWELLRGAFA